MATQVGETLGRYQLEQLVGQGGMAAVYKGVDSVLGRTVAVKVIRQVYAEDPHFLERFLQEARLVASLDHPNILPLYDFGEQDGRPYLVMPYLPGGSLADQMAALPQALPLVAAWTLQLGGALDAAHERGVLHRDVKPGNVMVTKDGRLVLGDFGIARLAEATTRLTATGMVVGTPIYMAPELARGADATPASDRYALAVMVYEMLAGLPPFVGSNPLSVLHQQVHEPVPTLFERSADATPELDAFMTRAMGKKPEERYASGRAMAEGLLTLLTPEQRAELSSFAWSGTPGSGEALPWSSPEAATIVRSGGTMRMAGPPGSAAARATPPRSTPPGSAHASAARSSGARGSAAGAVRASGPTRTGGAAASGGVLTSAVTAEAPRPGRSSGFIWGLVVAALFVVALVWMQRELSVGSTSTAGGVTPNNSAPSTDGTRAAPGTGEVQPSGTGAGPATGQQQAQASAQTGGSSGSPQAAIGGTGAAASGSEGRDSLDSPVQAIPATQTDIWLFGTSRPMRRPTEAELQRLLTRLSDRRAGQTVALQPLTAWARGALAYAQGRESDAREMRRDLAGTTAPWGIAWGARMFGQSKPWNLAAFYSDPRGELDDLLLPDLPGLAANPGAALAAAYSAHLDGDHRGALKLLHDTGLDAAATDATARALAAQFISAEALEAGDEAEAQRWLPSAIDGGNAPLVRAFVNEVTALTTHSFGAAQATALRNQLCAAAPNACFVMQDRPLAQSPAWQNQQQPQQTKPNNWNNRRWVKPHPTGSSGGGG